MGKVLNYDFSEGEFKKRYFDRDMLNFVKDRFKKKELIGAEVGVWRGTLSEEILNKLNIKKLYLIDSWKIFLGTKLTQQDFDNAKNEVYKKFKENNKVKIINDYSISGINDIDEKLDFVYIDSDHTYETTFNELFYYWYVLKKGGVIGGDDIQNYPNKNGVFKAVAEFSQLKNLEVNIKGRDWWIVKC